MKKKTKTNYMNYRNITKSIILISKEKFFCGLKTYFTFNNLLHLLHSVLFFMSISSCVLLLRDSFTLLFRVAYVLKFTISFSPLLL